jgi:purine nucleoside transport protein
MMFLGNTEAIAASRFQILKLSKERILTVAMMSMSCISAALVGSYTSMMPGAYVLTAIPLNVINALLVATIMNPYKLDKSEDEIATLYKKGEKKEPFFSYLGNSILGSGKLVLIICANVIAFVGLAAVINIILGAFNPLIHNFVN